MRRIVTTKLTNFASPTKSYEALFLVDAGATDCLVPAAALDEMGVECEGRMSYELADGTVRQYSYGLARIKFLGETTAFRRA